jgi:tripartite-type tricarboxylate transporter receptor subunit TctC
MEMKTRFLAASAVLALGASMAAAEYPEKPVEFVVPFPPGDLEDILTRMIAEDFQDEYGVPAAVVNKPGGGGGPFPGAVEVAMQPADGYTVGSFVMDVPVVGDEIGIEPLEPMPFEPVGIFLTYPFVIATSGDAPYSSMQELADHAQENDVALGHFGTVVLPTQVTLALAESMGFEYATDAAFDALDCNTLASGDADVINTTLQLIQPCLDEVKVLTALTNERISILPDVPIISEIEPDLSFYTWNGLFVHEDTPQEVRDKIAAVARDTVMSDRAQQVGEDTGALIYWLDAEEAAERIAADKELVARIAEMLE